MRQKHSFIQVTKDSFIKKKKWSACLHKMSNHHLKEGSNKWCHLENQIK